MTLQIDEFAREASPTQIMQEQGEVGRRWREEGIGVVSVEQGDESFLAGGLEENRFQGEVDGAGRLAEAEKKFLQSVQWRSILDADGTPRDAVQSSGLARALPLVALADRVENHGERGPGRLQIFRRFPSQPGGHAQHGRRVGASAEENTQGSGAGESVRDGATKESAELFVEGAGVAIALPWSGPRAPVTLDPQTTRASNQPRGCWKAAYALMERSVLGEHTGDDVFDRRSLVERRSGREVSQDRRQLA